MTPALLPLVFALAQEASPEKVDLRVDLTREDALQRFDRSDPRAWRLVAEGEGEEKTTALDLCGASEYAPPHRSPLNLALLRGYAFSDFVLDVEARQTGREYGHRDLCFFFAFASPARFGYVHLASKADPHAHNVFRVADADRESYAERTTDGITWGDGWHHVRIERRAADHRIRVFFDDTEHPVMEADEGATPFGRIGFGSFDDTGRFRDIRIRGTARRLPEDAPCPFPPRN